MKVFAFGCSLTFGTDLPDDNHTEAWPKPSSLTWPALVAKNRGARYFCQAQGGQGNLAIMSRVMAQSIYHECEDFFVINWTFADRFDYSDPNGLHFNRGVNDYVTLRISEVDPVSTFYFKNLHSEFRDKVNSLIYIKSVIDSLKAKNCRFLMTNIDDTLLNEKWHAPAWVIDLILYVKPYITNFEGRNFLDWSKTNNFEISRTGHPLVEAHARAAEIMMPSIEILTG